MGVCAAGAHLCANHEVGGVGTLHHGILRNGARKRGPAAAGVVLIDGCEQWLPADDIHIQALLEEIVIFPAEGPLRRGVLRDLIGKVADTLPQRGIFVFHVRFLLHRTTTAQYPAAQ